MSDKVISFIQPSRNNLKYLKWSYNSIRKNLGYRHEICWADDFSDDGTWEWMNEIKEKDPNVKIHRNEGPTRLGHTILYDTLVDMATNDIVMIYHADMYACPNLDTEILKHLERGKVVSATRIEPPLHPDGPEKVLSDFGIEPEEFDEEGLLKWIKGWKRTQGNDTTLNQNTVQLYRDHVTNLEQQVNIGENYFPFQRDLNERNELWATQQNQIDLTIADADDVVRRDYGETVYPLSMRATTQDRLEITMYRY